MSREDGDERGLLERCRGIDCYELHGDGRKGWFTLRVVGDNSLVAVEISDKERKHARRFGGFIFDREMFAKCVAYQLSKEPLAGSFVPLPRGGKMYTLPWTARKEDGQEKHDEKEWWDE